MEMIRKSEMWQRIKAARKRAGLTQADVAAHFDIDRTAITQWEARSSSRRTRPDIARLEEFAHLTRTPVWWLLSDEVDVLEPWPDLIEKPDGASQERKGPFVRAFWDQAILNVKQMRPDLWDDEVWSPKVPTWMNPLVPDGLTKRCIVNIVHAHRIDVARIAQQATALLGFERLQGVEYPRKAVLIWCPAEAPNQPPVIQTYRHDVVRVREGASILTERLGIRYIEVENTQEAAHYLVQLL